MAIQIVVDRIVNTNINKKSILIVMADNQPSLAFRKAEIPVARDFDVDNFLSTITNQQKTTLWNRGTETTATHFRNANKKENTPFLEVLTDNIIEKLLADDLNSVYDEIIAYLDGNQTVKSNIVTIIGNLQVLGELPPTKRERVLWLLVLSLIQQSK